MIIPVTFGAIVMVHFGQWSFVPQRCEANCLHALKGVLAAPLAAALKLVERFGKKGRPRDRLDQRNLPDGGCGWLIIREVAFDSIDENGARIVNLAQIVSKIGQADCRCRGSVRASYRSGRIWRP